jgi:hypothetical protein|tara:strand:- start:2462 stop:2932 length:471 start_codon:yes stop_codon:yes gene_type:complete
MRIDIDVHYDDDEAQDRLDDIQRRGKNFKPPLEEIRDELQKAWTGNFMSNGLAVGGWKPLDAEYASWKAAHYPGAPPLIQTGELFKAISTLRGVEVDIDRHKAEFSLKNIRVAKFHQYGTEHMAKREIIFEPAGADKRWGRMMREYLKGDDDGDAF